jgi:hypothetical protein
VRVNPSPASSSLSALIDSCVPDSSGRMERSHFGRRFETELNVQHERIRASFPLFPPGAFAAAGTPNPAGAAPICV